MPKKLTLEEFIAKSKKIHEDRYDYSKVEYVNTYTKVEIICKEHGPFWQDPHNHMKGKGCPKCVSNYKLTQDDFIQKATKRHNGFYDYSLVKYEKNAAKVDIICPLHGVFQQEANSHLQGHGCPECALSKIGDSDYTSRVKTRVRTCLEKYGVSNPMQIESVKAKNLNTKSVNGTFNTSRIEEDVYLRLTEKFGHDDVVRQYKSKKYPYRCDFYIKSIDLYIEVNAFWTHNDHWFDKNNPSDVLEKNFLLEKYGTTWGNIWWLSDVRKRNSAIRHNLNYVVLWNNKDVDEWFSLGCPIGNDALQLYSWRITN